ncbi:MAG TPA: tetratricopeptide repeat protein [Pyrinomonadaceae bacterium]|nr:tetratricopeptide repeat protein [Pyrinomonadaceae bacterium]
MRSTNYRRLALLLSVLLALPFCEVRNHAEETVSVRTDYQPEVASPIYVIAAPSQAKIPPRPLDIPIVSTRKPPSASPSEADLQLPFAMSGDRAVRIGYGLLADSAIHMALAYFEVAQKEMPGSVEVKTGVAHCYYELKRDDEALALYKEVIAQNAGLWEVQYNLGRIYLEHGKYPEAVEAFNSALKLKPGDPEIISSLGVALTKSGKNTEAIPHLTQVVDMKRYIQEDFYNLGEAYANEGQWSKAAEIFKKGAETRGLDPNGYFYWGTMLFNEDKIIEAFDVYQIAKKKDLEQNHWGTSLYLADIYRLRGSLTEALGSYRQVLKQKPDHVESLFHAGYISFKLAQLGEAMQFFKKLMAIDPKHAGAAANFAALDARDNEVRKSRKEATPGVTLREVAQANPNSAEAHTNLGAQLITEGIYPEAVAALQKAVALKPDSAAAQYNLGLAQLKTGEFQNAVVSITKALELTPNWPDAYNNLGLAYAGLENYDDAVKAYREAIRIVPDYAGATYNLGIAYVGLGQGALALPLVEKLKPMNWDLQARLWNAIHTAKARTTVITEIVEARTPKATPSPESARPENVARVAPDKPAAEADCPDPIYRASGVTRMASFVGELQASYSEEALQNNAQGKIVLQVVLCGNGRVSDITVEERLPFGLTERTIEVMKKAQFQPAELNSKPVTVMIKQEFVCASGVCKAVVKP